MRSRASDAAVQANAPNAPAEATPSEPRVHPRQRGSCLGSPSVRRLFLQLGLALAAGVLLGVAAAVRLPAYAAGPRWLLRLDARMSAQRAATFRAIAAGDTWNNPAAPAEERATVAGPGSSMAYTAPVREWLGSLLHDAEMSISTLADLSCSELLWQTQIPGWRDLRAFSGYDIVPEVVNRARARAREAVGEAADGSHLLHGAIQMRRRAPSARGPVLSFAVADIAHDSEPLGKFDLLLLRDTLMHLPLTDALRALERIDESGSRWLATTTFDTATPNAFIQPGAWYPINLELPPFELGPPHAWVAEGIPGVEFYGVKKLALWRLPALGGMRPPANGTQAGARG